jgi:ferredoxin
MSRPLWFVALLKKLLPDRFWMAKLTHVPPIGAVVDYSLFRDDDVIYLPRDGTIQVYENIPEPEDMVLPSQIVEHFIEAANYHWVMDFCICREGGDCQDYPKELGCIFLGEAVTQINPKLGRLVSKEEALEHARRCREAGLVHMIGRNRLDVVWLGANPGDKLMTICNCCPCCCLWKMLPVLTPDIGKKISKMPGVTVTVTDLCNGCGTCTEGVCFVDAIRLDNDRAVITTECRGCGLCVEVCPNEAIELRIDQAAFVQNTIDRLSPLVDIT